MRVLFTIVPAKTHLYPIVPLARALENSGHEVRIASTPDMTGAILGSGLTAVPVGTEADLASTIDAASADPRLDRICDALRLDPADPDLWYSIRYMLAVAAMPFPPDSPMASRPSILADLVGFSQAWQPDLVLWDPYHLAAPIAARVAGAAHARLLWGMDTFGWVRDQLATPTAQRDTHTGADPLEDLISPALAYFDIEFDEELMVGQWSVDTMPDGLGFPLDLDYLRMRSVPYNGTAVAPDWLLELPSRPRVCLTLGVSRREFFADNEIPITDLSELSRGMDVEIVATLTREQISRATAGPTVPDNIRTVDYLPLNLLLPTCSAIVHHGGSGTFQNALVHRVPQLVIPGDHESKLTAEFVNDQRSGLVLDHSSFSMARLRESIRSLTTSPEFPRAATDLHEQYRSRPGPNEIVGEIERRVEGET